MNQFNKVTISLTHHLCQSQGSLWSFIKLDVDIDIETNIYIYWHIIYLGNFSLLKKCQIQFRHPIWVKPKREVFFFRESLSKNCALVEWFLFAIASVRTFRSLRHLWIHCSFEGQLRFYLIEKVFSSLRSQSIPSLASLDIGDENQLASRVFWRKKGSVSFVI